MYFLCMWCRMLSRYIRSSKQSLYRNMSCKILIKFHRSHSLDLFVELSCRLNFVFKAKKSLRFPENLVVSPVLPCITPSILSSYYLYIGDITWLCRDTSLSLRVLSLTSECNKWVRNHIQWTPTCTEPWKNFHISKTQK